MARKRKQISSAFKAKFVVEVVRTEDNHTERIAVTSSSGSGCSIEEENAG